MDGITEPPEERPGNGPEVPVAAAIPAVIEPLREDSPLPPPGSLWFALAGLQGGMLGVSAMLAWLGVSAAWQRRSFWTAPNLIATAFYGERAIRSGFAGRTLSGVALYLTLYSLLGAIFAVLIRDRLPRFRTVLMAAVFAVAWYFVAFQVIWRSLLPLVFLLHAARPMLLGHLIYGTFLGRYPIYLPCPALPVPPAPEPPPAEGA
jgi:hypothetical protein